MIREFSTKEMAEMIGISPQTLNNWYEWYYDDSFEKPEGVYLLPYREEKRGKQGSRRYFNRKHIPILLRFKEILKYTKGMMADYNRKKTGVSAERLEQVRIKNEKMRKLLEDQRRL